MTSLKPRLQLALLRRKARLNGKQSQSLLQKGFTLIELIVVVLIIGILAAIAIPNFLDQASKAKGTECTNKGGSILKQVYGESLNSVTDADALGTTLALEESNSSQYCTFEYNDISVISGTTVAVVDATGSGDLTGKYLGQGCVDIKSGKVDWVLDVGDSPSAVTATCS